MVVRRAHTISKGYMRGWADSRNRVDVIDLEEGRGYSSSIENATVVTHAYDPNVLAHDLEGEYALIENEGTPVLAALRKGLRSLTLSERGGLVAFLDMHLDRGRYADQFKVSTPARALLRDGSVVDTDLRVGDRMLLSRARTDLVKLSELGIERWPWHVFPTSKPMITGDGAVLMFSRPASSSVSTVAFPLSPRHLLVGGHGWEGAISPNTLIQGNSKRWLIGVPNSLRLDQASKLKAERHQAHKS